MDDNWKQLIIDYQTVFGTDVGKRVFDDLRTRFNFRESFATIVQCGLPEHTALELGKREAFLYILDKIEADPNVEQQGNTQENTEMEFPNAAY